MKYLLISLMIIIFIRCHNHDHKEGTNIPMYPKTIYNNHDEGSIIQINDSVVVVYNKTSMSASDSKVVNIKNMR